ncbi:MAG: hypothetical protein GY938_24315, partial [Ketobacter sp.]|nr:hypothetical protein [Ketobacter sp.]
MIKFRGEVTTTVRNTFDVPTGETWLIWNVTTDKLEIGDDAEVWSAVGTNVFDDIVYTPTDVLPTATKGTTYFDDSESTLKQYNGSVWEPVGVTAGSGDFKADGSVTGTGVFQQNLSGSTYFGLLSGLNDDQTSNSNTGFGDEALKTVVTGSNNTAVGRAALELATGNNNTAVGSQALLFQTTGYGNTAVGSQALQLITDGVFNTAVGRYALDAATGSSNVGLGANALTNLTGDTNSDNIGIGQASGQYISGGVTDLTAATNSIFIGTEAFPLANSQTNQIVIGHQAVGNGSNTVTIGNSSVTDYYLSGNLDLDGNITIDGTVDDVDMDEVVIGTHPTRLHTQVNSITFET